jgi:nucleotidyltransferase substrate binding protein (TIGR01987 family)
MKEKNELAKLHEALAALEHALTFEKQIAKDPFYFAGIAKSFEIAFEYCWKYFKHVATEEGMEPFSPREAIKIAGQVNRIEDVKQWLAFLDTRNLAVHDYLGVPQKDYLRVIKEFLIAAKRIK